MDGNFKEEINKLHAQICGGLADPNRILILYALADQPHYVTALAETLGLPQSTMSRHLKILRERGLVKAQRDGQSVEYSLVDTRVIEALDLLRNLLADVLEEQSTLAQKITR